MKAARAPVSIRAARDTLGRIFFQRCFWLFVVLLALIAVVPFIESTPTGRIAVNAVNAFVVVATVAAVGRTLLSFVIALLLAAPTLVFHFLAVSSGDASLLELSWLFGGALYFATVVYLLRYVFHREVMTTDKLFGAAAGYLMLGVFFAYVFAFVQAHYPGAFLQQGVPTTIDPLDLLYFSFTVLTSTGFGDIVPALRQARAICVVEQLTGALFLAILIARLAGVYPPQQARADNAD